MSRAGITQKTLKKQLTLITGSIGKGTIDSAKRKVLFEKLDALRDASKALHLSKEEYRAFDLDCKHCAKTIELGSKGPLPTKAGALKQLLVLEKATTKRKKPTTKEEYYALKNALKQVVAAAYDLLDMGELTKEDVGALKDRVKAIFEKVDALNEEEEEEESSATSLKEIQKKLAKISHIVEVTKFVTDEQSDDWEHELEQLQKAAERLKSEKKLDAEKVKAVKLQIKEINDSIDKKDN